VFSKHGLLSTVGYQLGSHAPCVYALEVSFRDDKSLILTPNSKPKGSVAIAGAAVSWLRDMLGIVERSADVEALVKRDIGMAKAGESASYLPLPPGQPSGRHARRVLCHSLFWALGPVLASRRQGHHRGPDVSEGLEQRTMQSRNTCASLSLPPCSQYSSKAHIARATLEAVCFQVWQNPVTSISSPPSAPPQTREVLEAMIKDSGFKLTGLRVDGGMTSNDLLMQLQADLLGCDVCKTESGAFAMSK
jgi:glycerol kinase